MKRVDLIQHLELHGCELVREGKQHTLYINRQTKESSAVRVTVRFLLEPCEAFAALWLCLILSDKVPSRS